METLCKNKEHVNFRKTEYFQTKKLLQRVSFSTTLTVMNATVG